MKKILCIALVAVMLLASSVVVMAAEVPGGTASPEAIAYCPGATNPMDLRHVMIAQGAIEMFENDGNFWDIEGLIDYGDPIANPADSSGGNGWTLFICKNCDETMATSGNPHFESNPPIGWYFSNPIVVYSYTNGAGSILFSYGVPWRQGASYDGYAVTMVDRYFLGAEYLALPPDADVMTVLYEERE